MVISGTREYFNFPSRELPKSSRIAALQLYYAGLSEGIIFITIRGIIIMLVKRTRLMILVLIYAHLCCIIWYSAG